uniref:Nucleic acid-binding, OB-fold n=1 Tax=Tanacetum cinerariifolium TaxID=118510 RepID=A0A6L2KNZ3_TANCI|nr:nucleic acid-binding, OB-fold [Tanacetum cinerariifolium]
MVTNGILVGKPEEWVHPCYRLSTWKEVYSHKVQPINGSNNWVRSLCPTNILPPNYRVPIGRPKKKRTRSLCEKNKMVMNGAGTSGGVFGNQRQTSGSQSGVSQVDMVGAGTLGGVFGNQRQTSGSQAGVSQVDMVGRQSFGSQADMVGSQAFGSEANGIRTQTSAAGNGNKVNLVQRVGHQGFLLELEEGLLLGAISMVLSGRYTVMFKPVVQVIEIKCRHTQTKVEGNRVEKKEFYDIILSDGSVCKNVTIDCKIDEMIRSKQLQKGSIVQLTQFSSGTSFYISVRDLNVIRCNCIILGDPKPFSGNETPSVNEFITPKSDEDHVDPDVNDDIHHADEPTAPKQKCSSCSQTQSRKRESQSSDNKEDGEIGACFEKLEKLGWEEGPIYDTAVLLFGESSDYRKIWLHLKPKSCVNWVKNAGGMLHRGSMVPVCDSMRSLNGDHETQYNTAIFLFGENADYRKLWLLLKPESCGKWVKNAGINWVGCIAYDIFVSNKLRKGSIVQLTKYLLISDRRRY